MKKLGFLLIVIFSFSFFIPCMGQSWMPVGGGVNGTIYALDSAYGKFYAGGVFDSAGGNKVANIAAWNGSSWSALGTGVNGVVYALVVYNGNLYVGGSFTTAGGSPANSIAMWNGSTWSALGMGVDGTICALTVYNGNLYAGGYFTSAGGTPANSIAMWNGSSWSALGTGVNSQVNTLAVYNGSLYAGGYFNTAGGIKALLIAKWNGAWDSLGGIIQESYSCPSGSYISSLAAYKGNLFAGGLFSTEIPSGSLKAWNGTIWVSVPGGNGYVSALTPYNGNLIVGDANNGPSDIASCNGTSWDSIGHGIVPCEDPIGCNGCAGSYPFPEIFAIAVYNGILYAGGSFLASYGNQASYLIKYAVALDTNNTPSDINLPTIYPNPNNGIFTVYCHSEPSEEISL